MTPLTLTLAFTLQELFTNSSYSTQNQWRIQTGRRKREHAPSQTYDHLQTFDFSRALQTDGVFTLKACPHWFPKQDTLSPETVTLLTETATKSPVSGYKASCFGNQCGQAFKMTSLGVSCCMCVAPLARYFTQNQRPK